MRPGKTKLKHGLGRVKVSPHQSLNPPTQLGPGQPSCWSACPHSHASWLPEVSSWGWRWSNPQSPWGLGRQGAQANFPGKAKPWMPNPHGNWTQTQASGWLEEGLGPRPACSPCQAWTLPVGQAGGALAIGGDPPAISSYTCPGIGIMRIPTSQRR